MKALLKDTSAEPSDDRKKTHNQWEQGFFFQLKFFITLVFQSVPLS